MRVVLAGGKGNKHAAHLDRNYLKLLPGTNEAKKRRDEIGEILAFIVPLKVAFKPNTKLVLRLRRRIRNTGRRRYGQWLLPGRGARTNGLDLDTQGLGDSPERGDVGRSSIFNIVDGLGRAICFVGEILGSPAFIDSKCPNAFGIRDDSAPSGSWDSLFCMTVSRILRQNLAGRRLPRAWTKWMFTIRRAGDVSRQTR